MTNDLVILGAGGHCLSVIDVATQAGWIVAGLITQPEDRCKLPVPILGTDADLPEIRQQYAQAIVGVGQIKSATTRQRLYELLQQCGFTLPVLKSPLAHVGIGAEVGAGTVVMHYALVNACAQVGENCIINSRALVEHETIVGDHCHISTGAILNGAVRVGSGTFVGSGAVVKQGVTIGKNCLIAMGVNITRDVADGSLVR